MLDFKPKRKLKLKPDTPLSGLLANSWVRFGVAGFFSLLVTLLLFIFMNYLLGNFDKYAQSITENLFSLSMVKLDRSPDTEIKSGSRAQRVQLPPAPAALAQSATDDKPVTNEQRRRMMIEMLLGEREGSDNAGETGQNKPGPE